MGDILSGVFGGGSRTTQDVQADPVSQELNRMRLEQLSSLFAGTPFASFAGPQSEVYKPSPDVATLLSQATPAAETNFDNLMSLEEYKNLGLDASQNYINKIAKPEILSTAALAGLEGGGYVPDAIARATALTSLPFVQSLPQASTAFNLAPAQQRLLNAQAAGTTAQRASSLFPLADYSRVLGEQDLLRRQGVVTTGLTGLPYTPTTSTAERKSSQPLFNFFGQG